MVQRNINLLNPRLKWRVKIIKILLKWLKVPMQVFETKRGLYRQTELVRKGYSKTLKSKHLTGSAVDFVVYINGEWSWAYKKHKEYYQIYGKIVKLLLLEWGGSWSSFRDYPHAELKTKEDV